MLISSGSSTNGVALNNSEMPPQIRHRSDKTTSTPRGLTTIHNELTVTVLDSTQRTTVVSYIMTVNRNNDVVRKTMFVWPLSIEEFPIDNGCSECLAQHPRVGLGISITVNQTILLQMIQAQDMGIARFCNRKATFISDHSTWRGGVYGNGQRLTQLTKFMSSRVKHGTVISRRMAIVFSPGSSIITQEISTIAR